MQWELGGLMLIMLAIEIWGVGKGGTKWEMESGVGEWGKQCGGCCFCDPCMF
jgi:hypothetical protein